MYAGFGAFFDRILIEQASKSVFNCASSLDGTLLSCLKAVYYSGFCWTRTAVVHLPWLVQQFGTLGGNDLRDPDFNTAIFDLQLKTHLLQQYSVR